MSYRNWRNILRSEGESGLERKTTGRKPVATQYDSLTWAADVTWQLEGLHLQAEWILNQQAYTRRGRAINGKSPSEPDYPLR